MNHRWSSARAVHCDSSRHCSYRRWLSSHAVHTVLEFSGLLRIRALACAQVWMSDHPPLPTSTAAATTTASSAAAADSTTTTSSSTTSSATTTVSPSAALRAALAERYGLDPLELDVMGRDELVALAEAMQAEEEAQVGAMCTVYGGLRSSQQHCSVH